MRGAMQEPIRGQGESDSPEATMAPAPSVLSDPREQLTPSTSEKPTIALMGMAREALHDLNLLVQALMKGEPEGAGAGEQPQKSSEQILSAAAQCEVGGDAVNGFVLGRLVFDLKRVTNQSEKIHESVCLSLYGWRSSVS